MNYKLCIKYLIVHKYKIIIYDIFYLIYYNISYYVFISHNSKTKFLEHLDI